ncbi:hypothetical protein PR370_27485, partial [Mycobacterium marinum]|uniref:hypothetical protein n=1 Tax=Mycobacterium marinum TaxID=1781 RepID=UPI002358ED3B
MAVFLIGSQIDLANRTSQNETKLQDVTQRAADMAAGLAAPRAPVTGVADAALSASNVRSGLGADDAAP